MSQQKTLKAICRKYGIQIVQGIAYRATASHVTGGVTIQHEEPSDGCPIIFYPGFQAALEIAAAFNAR